MYVSAKPGTFGGGSGAAVSRYRLRSLIGLLHIYLGSHPISLEDFPLRGACAAIDQMQRLRVRGCGFLCPSSLRLSVHG